MPSNDIAIHLNSYHVLKMFHVDISRRRDSNGTDSHACHVRRRRVGSVRRHGDQADVPFELAAELVVALNGS